MRLPRPLNICLAVSSLALLSAQSGCTQAPADAGNVTQERMLAADSDPDNWMGHGRTWSEQRFSPLADISVENVRDLSLAWSVELDTNRGQEATPIVVDGVMYISTAWSKVLAVNAATGEVLWRYDPEVDGAKGASACCDVVNRGVAVWQGKVFVGTIDGRLIALNAETGTELWDVATTDPDKPYTITGAPRVFKDKVIIGNGGAELGVRGYVTAYDTETGEQAWRFYTVPGNPADGPDGAASDAVFADFAQKTWNGNWWEMGGGGTVWDSIVYDAELDQLLIGVGNGSPQNHRARSAGQGDNLFLASILALDPDTGAYKWHYQLNPAETWDFTATQQMTLADLEVDGKTRKVVMQAPKNGFFYVIDRTDGKLISAKPFVPQNWADHIDLETGRPVEREGARYADAPYLLYPAAIGGHSWTPMSFSPETGLVYFSSMHVPMTYGDDTNYTRRIGRWNTGISYDAPPEGSVEGATPMERAMAVQAQARGKLVAWDPIKQEARWEKDMPSPWNGGTLSTAGNLVFQGDQFGKFHAYNATTGEELWSFTGNRGIMAGPVSYRAGGEQFVAVLSGYGGSMAMTTDGDTMRRPLPNGLLLAFKIGGTDQLAKLPAQTLAPYVSSSESFTPAQLGEGAMQYYALCSICHTGPVTPDLLRSPMTADKDAWKAVVIDGVLADNGMISFAPWLSADQAESVRGFVLSQAAQRKAAQQAATGQAGTTTR